MPSSVTIRTIGLSPRTAHLRSTIFMGLAPPCCAAKRCREAVVARSGEETIGTAQRRDGLSRRESYQAIVSDGAGFVAGNANYDRILRRAERGRWLFPIARG